MDRLSHPAPLPFHVNPLRRALLRWYKQNQRDLPWRAGHDPYRVWVSEIMLQQTRVPVVLSYYEKFMQRFPSVAALARAREASVLAVWSGLGYYRRARALHAAAKMIVRDHGGEIPPSEAALRTLPGIGRYTAAAIASIAFQQPCAAVDGNVERVLGRLLGGHLSRARLGEAAAQVLSRRRPGDFNQAMMELGATVCLPRAPRCDTCPVEAFCATHGESAAGTRSRRSRKRVAYALSCDSRGVLLVQRPPNASLMPGMWELPVAAQTGGEAILRARHAITNTNYEVLVLRAAAGNHQPGRWMNPGQLARLPLTGLTRKILRKLEIIK